MNGQKKHFPGKKKRMTTTYEVTDPQKNDFGLIL
jgi:hypothetical protein